MKEKSKRFIVVSLNRELVELIDSYRELSNPSMNRRGQVIKAALEKL